MICENVTLHVRIGSEIHTEVVQILRKTKMRSYHYEGKYGDISSVRVAFEVDGQAYAVTLHNAMKVFVPARENMIPEIDVAFWYYGEPNIEEMKKVRDSIGKRWVACGVEGTI